MADYNNKPKDPNWVCTFSLKKNPNKAPKPGMSPEEIQGLAKRPDFVLVDSDKLNKKGEPFKKNFTINEVWCEGSGYIQEDKSLKITIKKTGTTAAAQPAQGGANFMDQF